MDLDGLLRRRLGVQHLIGQPATVVDYVGEAVAVQAQDPGTARWSIGMRADCDDLAVRAAIDAGELLRVHLLRPTWHYVHRDDLRWLQRLTGAKVAGSMPARHRQLGLSAAVIDAGFGVLQRELAGTALTRKQLQPLLPATAAPTGQVVGHLLMLAELNSLICSGPLVGTEHSYKLVDEVLGPETTAFDATQATRELVRRFFTWRGPASERDLARWCSLTLGQIRAALADLDLARVDVDGVDLWFDPTLAAPTADRDRRAFLLPTFDEVFLSYLRPNFPRSAAHPNAERPETFAESGGGLVIVDRHDIGRWKRSFKSGKLVVSLRLDAELSGADQELVAGEARRLADFAGAGQLEIIDAGDG